MRKSCGCAKWAGVLLALALVVAGCADVFFQTPEFDNPYDPINAASGTGALDYQGETTALTQLWFHDYGQDSSGSYKIDVLIGPAGVGLERGTGSGRVVYLRMFFDTDFVSAGTYNWADDDSAGSFSNQSTIVTLINDEMTDWADLFGGTVTIAISGSTYTISGNVTTDTGTAIFTYAGPLSGYTDYAAVEQWEGTGSGVLNFGGSPYALSRHVVDYYGEQTAGVYNYDLHFWSSDSSYSIYLEMFSPSDTIGAGTYVYSTTEEAGTFSDVSDIDIDGSIADLTGGTVTISIAGSIHTVIGDVETTGGPATFSYEGALMDR